MIASLLRIAATFSAFIIAAALYCIVCPLDAYAATQPPPAVDPVSAFLTILVIILASVFAYLIGRARGEHAAIEWDEDEDAPIRAEDFARKSQQ